MAVPSPATIPELIFASARQRIDQPALWRWRDGGFVPVSYGALVEAVTQISRRLRDYGAGPNRRVAVWVNDRFSWGITYLGVLWTGATAVPIDPLLTPREVAAILAEADPTLLVTDGSTPELPGRSVSVTMVRLSDIWPGFNTPAGMVPPSAIDPQALASILFTSGTTGTIKGVMLSHANIVSDVFAISALGLVGPRDKMLSVLPIHHAYECTIGFLYPLSIGAQVAYARSLKSSEIFEDLQMTQATGMIGVPLLFEKFVKTVRRRVVESRASRRALFGLLMGLSRALRWARWRGAGRILFGPFRGRVGLRSLRMVVSAAAPLPPEVAEFFDTIGLPLLQGYGLSEAAPAVAVNRPRGYRYDTVGPPMPGVQVTIREPGPDGIGEIAVKGPMVMRGYWRRPADTAAVIQDDWLLTGDLGSLERDGHLRIAGRSKNVIISGAGKNIYPEEIEAVLGDQPGVLESVVYGRKRPGKIGETVAAVIVPDPEWFQTVRPEALTDETVMRAAIDEAVRQACTRLAPYKRIVEWALRLEPFEKTATRKIKRFLVTGDALGSGLNAAPTGRRVGF